MKRNLADWRTKSSLPPGKGGTRKELALYGDALLKVRYRYNEETRTRIKTVELITDEIKLPDKAELALLLYVVSFRCPDSTVISYVIRTYYDVGDLFPRLFEHPRLKDFSPADWQGLAPCIYAPDGVAILDI